MAAISIVTALVTSGDQLMAILAAYMASGT
jgi:hypothetical protein